MPSNRVLIPRNTGNEDSQGEVAHSPSPNLIPGNDRTFHLRRSTSPDTLINELRRLQREKNEEQRCSLQLRRKLADITNNNDSNDEEPAAKKSKEDSGEEDVTDLVRRAAKQLAVMKTPWLYRANDMWALNLDESYNPLKRFEDEESRLRGQLEDVLEVLPEKLRGTAISLIPLQRTFREAMQSERSTAANRIRKQCGTTIFSVDNLMDREGLRERIGWGKHGRKWQYDPWNVEILHKDYDGKLDINKVFLNPILKYIFAALAFGPSSIEGLKNGSTTVLSQGSVSATEWGLTHITPGAIAMAAVMARWALSTDREFKNRGVQTGIPYEEDFFKYLEWLDLGIRVEGDSPAKKVLREWDQVFFPDTKDSLVGEESVSDEEPGSHNDAMRMLYESCDQDRHEDEGNQAGGEGEGDGENGGDDEAGSGRESNGDDL